MSGYDPLEKSTARHAALYFHMLPSISVVTVHTDREPRVLTTFSLHIVKNYVSSAHAYM